MLVPHLVNQARFWSRKPSLRELEDRGIQFDFEDHEIAHSIYFHDPDSHQLEITTYELG